MAKVLILGGSGFVGKSITRHLEHNKINYSSKLNHIISDTLYYVLNKSLYYSKISNGYYDPTVFPLVDLWGFGPTRKSTKPHENLIELTKKYVSYKNLSLDDKNNLFKQSANTFIDLSSLVKGYAVDVLSDYLYSLEIDDFMVDIGGELKCRGQNNRSDWIIGIINPTNNEIFVKTKINDQSIATSGTYNNFSTYDGVEYSHIINPKTGYPIVNPILSSTVIADKCIDADALATMLMVLSPHEGLKIINSINNVECLIIIEDDDGITRITSNGFKKFIVN